ncbi:MAG: serine hydrolase [bacterium]|nr:serine hydrolase [bacterium]
MIDRYYYPPAGTGMGTQEQRKPEAVGLKKEVIGELDEFVKAHPDARKRRSQRWALWRHGYLVHAEGEFDEPVDVASLRKTWHAMTVGAAILQGRISSYDQKVSTWLSELEGHHAEATWRDVMTQSAGFDYPYGDYPAFKPGEMWTYSDWNLVHFCNAMARVYGKRDFQDHYADVAREAYFDAIGMEGWSTRIVFDNSSQMEDGVRFVLSLEHMGRLGLFALARGRWNGRELVPRWFVEELETKQTHGMRVNYEGPNDGMCHLRFCADRFPECPYGYLTWTNSDGDYFPGADSGWAFGAGAGGSYILWNHRWGVVFAALTFDLEPGAYTVPQIVEANVVGDNPLLGA